MNISLLLDMAVEGFGDRQAIGRRGQSISYAELRARSVAACDLLATDAISQVAYVGLNSISLPIALFASSFLGRTFTPLNYRLPDATLAQLVQRTAPSTVIVDEEMAHRVPTSGGISKVLRSSFEAACRRTGVVDRPDIEIEGNDVAVMLFTSGTTGVPKAAMLKHSNLLSYVISTVELGCADEEEAALVSVPPYHIAGISALITGLYAGRRIVHLSAFDEAEWVTVAESEKITHAMVVPTMLQRILDEIERRKITLPFLKHLSYGGGRMPLPIVERAMQFLPHVDFVNAYGLTETSSTISILSPDDHRRAMRGDDASARKRLTSVGKPLPHIDLEVRDPSGKILAAGAVGEVWVRGEQISGEYVGQRAVKNDGWFPTKDRGWLDEEGYLFIDGRMDDVIVHGGENISPGEIEDVLRAHDAVADAAVFGLPDEEWGERIVAVVIPKGDPTENALKAWVKERLRSTRTPSSIFFSEMLPYNETGKLLRRILQEQYAAGDGCVEISNP